MCISFIHYLPSASEGEYLLVAAVNRDESFQRPTAAADFWANHPNVLGGRDLVSGGTWCGITTDGRFSVLTNYGFVHNKTCSVTKPRGKLVSNYLTSAVSSVQYSNIIRKETCKGYSVITADLKHENKLVYTSNNDPNGFQILDEGVYGLSNSHLDSPWHKVTNGKIAFADIVNRCRADECNMTEELFDLLSDDTSYWPDTSIRNTGACEEFNQHVSSIFMNPYEPEQDQWPYSRCGTMSQTVIVVKHDGQVLFTERSFDSKLSQWNKSTYRFTIDD